ncbi:MAG: deoxyribonuclease V [Saprospiraceae bacterium]
MDFQPYYDQQEQLRTQTIYINQLPASIRYVAGADVAYSLDESQAVGGIVILDTTTLEVVESVSAVVESPFPYVPGLFSFREIPPLLAAFEKLTIRPDLLVCDGHGIAHPKRMGMATHLGIELDLPTIGCAKKRLTGQYDKSKLAEERGATLDLTLENEVIGNALRTQFGIKPVFVSIGHKIDLATANEWILKLSPTYRLPETTRQADQLVNKKKKNIISN